MKQEKISAQLDKALPDMDFGDVNTITIYGAVEYALPSTLDRLPEDDCFGEIVTLEVGAHTRKQNFSVHKGALAFYSGFSRAALQEKWQDPQSGNIILLSEEISVVKRFVLWLYTRKLANDNEELGFTELVELWSFANTREIPALANVVLNKISDKFRKDTSPHLDNLQFLYENTTPKSGLRRLHVDILAHACGPSVLKRRDMWPVEALWDVMNVRWKQDYKRWTKADVDALDICQYHDHGEGVKCADAKAIKQWLDDDQHK